MASNSRLLKDINSSPVLLIPSSMSVMEAATLMQRARTDAGLVEAPDGSLVGILTDSDVSIKVIASGRSVIRTTVVEAMTPRPLCVRESETAGRALALMAEKRARHLPLLDDEGAVSGMLDVAKVLYDAIHRLELQRAGSTASLFGFGNAAIPMLTSALEGRPPPATARPEDLLGVAFDGLVATRRSVLVLGDDGKLVGILSKSDVAKRALRAASSVTQGDGDVELLRSLRVSEVMTPRPDSISASKNILDALHKMHDGNAQRLLRGGTFQRASNRADAFCLKAARSAPRRPPDPANLGKYSNLPVLGADDVPVGVVDVLDLLRAADPDRQAPSATGKLFSEGLGGGLFADLFSGAESSPPEALPETATAQRLSLDNDDVVLVTKDDADEPVAVANAVTAEAARWSSGALQNIKPSALVPAFASVVPLHRFAVFIVHSRETFKVDAVDFKDLVAALCDKLKCSAGALYFEYVENATMRVSDQRTLAAASALHEALDATSTSLPLKLTVARRGFGLATFVGLAAVAALAAVALSKAK